MRISAGRLQGIGAGALVLAAVVAAPGLSAAQSGETTPDVYEAAPPSTAPSTVPDGLSGPVPDRAPSAAATAGAPAIKQTLAASQDRAAGEPTAKAAAAARLVKASNVWGSLPATQPTRPARQCGPLVRQESPLPCTQRWAYRPLRSTYRP